MVDGYARPRQFVPGLLWGLAAGLAAGALVLAPIIPGFTTVEATRNITKAEGGAQKAKQELTVSQAQTRAANTFVSQQAAAVLPGVLDGVNVGIVALPGADGKAISAIESYVSSAGGSVTDTVTLSPSLFTKANADQVETMVTSILPAGQKLDTGQVVPGKHAGQLVAAALMSSPTGTPLAQPDERAIVINALKKGSYLEAKTGVSPVRVVIIVAGPPSTGEDAAFVTAAQMDFVAGFTKTGKAVVAAGPASSATPAGVIGKLRDKKLASLSTVDSIEYAYAQVAAVLAAREELEGQTGNYGAASTADNAMPPIPKNKPPKPHQPGDDQPGKPAAPPAQG